MANDFKTKEAKDFAFKTANDFKTRVANDFKTKEANDFAFKTKVASDFALKDGCPDCGKAGGGGAESGSRRTHPVLPVPVPAPQPAPKPLAPKPSTVLPVPRLAAARARVHARVMSTRLPPRPDNTPNLSLHEQHANAFWGRLSARPSIRALPGVID